MDMTVKQISDELGVNRQKIYRYIKKENPVHHYRGSGKTMYFSENEVEKMRAALTGGSHEQGEDGHSSESAAHARETADEKNELTALREKIARLEEEKEFIKAESEYRRDRADELTKQRNELLGLLRSSNENVRRLTESVRSLTDSLRASQLMQADAVKRLDNTRSEQKRLAHSERSEKKVTMLDVIMNFLRK